MRSPAPAAAAPYMLIVYALAEKINSGELKPGDRVPSVTELVKQKRQPQHGQASTSQAEGDGPD